MNGIASVERIGRPNPTETAMRVAVVASLSATTMLFASLASAYLVRRSFIDWTQPKGAAWPWVLLSLALAASAGLEVALRSSPARRRIALQGVGLVTALYFASAVAVIRSMASGAGGLGPPHHAFVALLLGVHVVHSVAGGAFAAWLFRDASDLLTPARSLLARLVTHFLAGLVLFIVLLLFVVQ